MPDPVAARSPRRRSMLRDLPPALVVRYCTASRALAEARIATPTEIELAAHVFATLVGRGLTTLPFGTLLDLTLLARNGWEFPFRPPDHHAAPRDTLASATPDPAARTTAAPPQGSYADHVLRAFLLAPRLRAVRDLLTRADHAADRLAAWLESLTAGLTAWLPPHLRLGHLPFDAVRLAAALDAAVDASNSPSASRPPQPDPVPVPPEPGLDDDQRPLTDAVLPGFVAELHRHVATFLAARLHASDAHGPIPLWRPTPVDLFELEHVGVFGSRVMRLRARRFGAVAEQIGPPDLRSLPRPLDAPEVVTDQDDETLYPAGGVGEFTNRGSFESLVPSELMYLDDAPLPRPSGTASRAPIDLFSLKYVENELLYFTRDEGLLVRRRRVVHLVIYDPDGFRLKHARQPHGLDTYLDGLLLRTIRDLFTVHTADGLRLHLHWVSLPAFHAAGASTSAGSDADLFALLFRNDIARGALTAAAHTSPAHLADAIPTLDHPHATWIAIAPPLSASTTPASRSKADDGQSDSSGTDATCILSRPNLRPIEWIRLHIEPHDPTGPRRPASVHSRGYPHATPHPDTTARATRVWEYRFPTDVDDPTAALHGLRQLILSLSIRPA